MSIEHEVFYVKPGDNVDLVVDEPWELVSSLKDPHFSCQVVDIEKVDREAIVIKLNRPLDYKGGVITYLLALARHEGDKFGGASKRSVFSSLISMSEAQGGAGVPSSPAEFRGDLMLLGDISW